MRRRPVTSVGMVHLRHGLRLFASYLVFVRESHIGHCLELFASYREFRFIRIRWFVSHSSCHLFFQDVIRGISDNSLCSPAITTVYLSWCVCLSFFLIFA